MIRNESPFLIVLELIYSGGFLLKVSKNVPIKYIFAHCPLKIW